MKRIAITIDGDALQIEREDLDTYESLGVLVAADSLILLEARANNPVDGNSVDTDSQDKKVLPEG